MKESEIFNGVNGLRKQVESLNLSCVITISLRSTIEGFFFIIFRKFFTFVF